MAVRSMEKPTFRKYFRIFVKDGAEQGGHLRFQHGDQWHLGGSHIARSSFSQQNITQSVLDKRPIEFISKEPVCFGKKTARWKLANVDCVTPPPPPSPPA
ncbi:hypothetical protein KIN20_009536 [Parelaphostrongylus tenuis]|uniref:Uncharacterized protein n=1 Tax=Parelaphostrongylus tenuis TaxID=148309 RepID=A0AAD5M6I0_PARTN|nr:hypothetical protein KIN20_009536 [Parelaphostrongylus tenuis]